MKTVSFKIEIRDTRLPVLYAVSKYLQDRGEDVPKMFRDWLLHKYLPWMLLDSKAEPEEILQAVASQRRSLMTELNELDLIEVRCRQLMGQPIPVPTVDPAPQVPRPSADSYEAETETIEDTW